MPVRVINQHQPYTMNRLLTLAAWLLLSPSIYCQISGNILYNETNRWKMQNEVILKKAAVSNPNQVVFDVNGMFNMKADSYLAIFHITQIGSTAREADSLMNRRLQNFREDVMAAGIPEDKFIIDMLSMVPVYEVNVEKRFFSKTYTEIPTGFEIQKNIHIHFAETQVLDKIITSAAINEIYDLIKVDYYVKDVEGIYDSLREAITKVVKKRMAQFENLGIPISNQWRMANDQIGVFFPLDRYQSYEAFAYTSIDASRKRSQVSEMRKPKTVFYNKIPYTNYDVVINPEILEPAVQYTYSLQIVFNIEKPIPKPDPKPEVKIETQTKYILLTTDGQLKPLDLK
jgi:uncharacterized protein YggE